jgi:hypothetical protein
MVTEPMKTISVGIMKPTLTAEYLRDMWVLYSHYYNVDQRSFFYEMGSNDFYAIYTNGKKLIGFTGFRYRKINTNYGTCQVLHIGQTVMDENFRGRSLVPRTCLSLFVKHYLRHPFRPLYAWCDAITFKPYMVFAKGMETFYPTFKEATPPKIKSVLANLGNQYYGVNYNPGTNVVRKFQKMVNDDSANISAQDLENPHIAFYNQQNPNHIHGNGFLVIAPINFRNLFFLVKKCITKGFFKLWKS